MMKPACICASTPTVVRWRFTEAALPGFFPGLPTECANSLCHVRPFTCTELVFLSLRRVIARGSCAGGGIARSFCPCTYGSRWRLRRRSASIRMQTSRHPSRFRGGSRCRRCPAGVVGQVAAGLCELVSHTNHRPPSQGGPATPTPCSHSSVSRRSLLLDGRARRSSQPSPRIEAPEKRSAMA